MVQHTSPCFISTSSPICTPTPNPFQMAAAAVIRVAACSSRPSIPSSFTIFTNFRSESHLGVIPVSANPFLFSSPRHRRSMAHVVAKATLGLTHPAQIDHPKISFSAKETDVVEWKGDILAVGVTEQDMAKDDNSKFQNPILKKLDSQSGGLLSEVSTEEEFTGKAGQSTVVRLLGLGSKRVSLVGLGKVPAGSSTAAYYGLGESVATAAKASRANNVAIALASFEGLTPESKLATASAIAKGTFLGTYEDNGFKYESKTPALKFVDHFGLGAEPELKRDFRRGKKKSLQMVFLQQRFWMQSNARH